MEVEKLIALMRENRVLKVKMGGLEVELSPTAFAADVAPEAKGPAPVPMDFTMWSVQDQSPIVRFDKAEEEES